jgi:hypothetical protein
VSKKTGSSDRAGKPTGKEAWVVPIVVAALGVIGVVGAAYLGSVKPAPPGSPPVEEKPKHPEGFGVHGHVRDAESNEPIGGAQVTLEKRGSAPLSQHTRSSGMFDFKLPGSLAGSGVLIKVAADGYQSEERSLGPEQSGFDDLDFRLKRATAGRALYLSDLEPHDPPQNVEGGLREDRVHLPPHRIILETQTWEKGLGMHAPAQGIAAVEYALPAGAKFFSGRVGLVASESGPCSSSVSGSARARILVDGTKRGDYNLVGMNAYQDFKIPVSGRKVLRLEVDHAGDSNECDSIAWADAKLE